ncbi:MAG: hypothetical protein M3542_00935 [Acidobacteriota bacterium]|nr:hypothetical protein [Acidobacteriota bacterium]
MTSAQGECAACGATRLSASIEDPARLAAVVLDAEEKLASAIMAAGQSFTKVDGLKSSAGRPEESSRNP